MEDMERMVLKIEQIDWPNRQMLGYGKEGVVYRVAPGLAAKVGQVSKGGYDLQKLMCENNIALPVLGFVSSANIPTEVAYEICAVHGVRRELMSATVNGATQPDPDGYCRCQKTWAGILLMPEAEPLTAEERRSNEVKNFRRRLQRWLKKNNKAWDYHNPNNVMRYRGRLVAIDIS
jgi:hypothetical protein